MKKGRESLNTGEASSPRLFPPQSISRSSPLLLPPSSLHYTLSSLSLLKSMTSKRLYALLMSFHVPTWYSWSFGYEPSPDFGSFLRRIAPICRLHCHSFSFCSSSACWVDSMVFGMSRNPVANLRRRRCVMRPSHGRMLAVGDSDYVRLCCVNHCLLATCGLLFSFGVVLVCVARLS